MRAVIKHLATSNFRLPDPFYTNGCNFTELSLVVTKCLWLAFGCLCKKKKKNIETIPHCLECQTSAIKDKLFRWLCNWFLPLILCSQSSYPIWEDFITKGSKLQSQLRWVVSHAAHTWLFLTSLTLWTLHAGAWTQTLILCAVSIRDINCSVTLDIAKLSLHNNSDTPCLLWTPKSDSIN